MTRVNPCVEQTRGAVVRGLLLLIAFLLAVTWVDSEPALARQVHQASVSARAVAGVAEQAIDKRPDAKRESPDVPSPTPGATAEAAETPLADLFGQMFSAPDESGQSVKLALAAENVLPTPDGRSRQMRIPILMYHYISDPPRGADMVRRDLSLAGSDFEVQLRYLASEGYHSVSLYDLLMHLQRGAALPEKPIALTFDDGYKDAFTVAFPLLQKYGFKGTFFIFTKPIIEENRDYLSWRDVELMSAAGMEFGSHSYSHPDLRGRSPEFMAREIVKSKEDIEAHIRRPVRFFCYPSGSYDRKVVKAIKSAGYWAAVTTQQGVEHTTNDLLELSRIRVHGESGLERFDALLNLNW